jgi:hypothetical protein
MTKVKADYTMEQKHLHLASPIYYKAVNGGGMWMLISKLEMGREKVDGAVILREQVTQ